MIIHKTMKLPTSCTMCWISNTCDVWTSETCKHHGYDKRLEDCPLEEVKTGRWKREVLGSTSGYYTTVMYRCSECESLSISKYRCCPNCGANMEVENEC